MRTAVLMVAIVLTASIASAADVDGKWTGSIDTPMGAVQVGFTFKSDGAKLTGTTTSPDGAEVAIKNGKVDGGKISFTVDLDFGGMAISLEYTGVVTKDKIDMTADFMGMPFSFAVERAKS